MYNNRLVLFILSVICGINAQYYLDDPCETDDGMPGVCRYEQTCKYALELIPKLIHPSVCGFESRTLIVCCPEDYNSGIFGRTFARTEGMLSNRNLTCHYDGYLPMMCCPNSAEQPQPPEPEGCPPLPRIRTPPFQNPAHKVAWEQCVANERYVNICEHNGNSYNRRYTCSIPFTSQRISGGVSASSMEFPHMAVLGVDSDINTESEIKWVGGGSLISSKYILTAAHVIVHLRYAFLGSLDKTDIRGGELFGIIKSIPHKLYSSANKPYDIALVELNRPVHLRYAFLGSLDKTDIRGGELFGIIKSIPHKLYSSANKPYDIALVELNRPVEFSKFIRPICLPVPGIDAEDDSRLVAGWGAAGDKASSTKFLQKAIISTVNGKECSSSLSWPGFVWDDKTMICARGTKSRGVQTDSCQGDSGGPLMYKVRNPEFRCNYVVDGVVSWGNVCGQGEPAIYTNVSAYIDWIVETVWPEEYKEASSLFETD